MDDQKPELNLLKELVLHGFVEAAGALLNDAQSILLGGLLAMQSSSEITTPETTVAIRKIFQDAQHLLREMWLSLESIKDDEDESELIRVNARNAAQIAMKIFCDTYDSEVQTSKGFTSEDRRRKQMMVAQMYSEIIKAVTGSSLVTDGDD